MLKTAGSVDEALSDSGRPLMAQSDNPDRKSNSSGRKVVGEEGRCGFSAQLNQMVGFVKRIVSNHGVDS
jgi:hypothetical protein